MAKRCTRKEANRRVETFAKMLVHGGTAMELRAYARENWGLSDKQAEHYIRQAREMIVESANIDRHEFVAEKIATLNIVIRKAMEAGQYSNCIGATRLLAELTGSMPK